MEFTEAEAKDVLTNPQNPHYQDSTRPGPVYDAVMGAFNRQYPGEIVIDNVDSGAQAAMASSLKERGISAEALELDKPLAASQPVTLPQAAGLQEGTYAKEWDMTVEQATPYLQQQRGENYLESLKTDVNTVLSGFVTTPERQRYVNELLMLVGNHPLHSDLLTYLASRIQGAFGE